jgi:hypothetical protein
MTRMSKDNRIRNCWVSFFVALLICFVTSCSTPSEQRVLGRHLESYRKVYLVKGQEDPREVTPRISSRLQLAGFSVTEISREMAKTIDKVVSEKEAREPALICVFGYMSIGDPAFYNDHSFQSIHIYFYDLQKGDLVYKVSDYKYYPDLQENAALNRLFIQISDDFFPNQPNPFKGKK